MISKCATCGNSVGYYIGDTPYCSSCKKKFIPEDEFDKKITPEVLVRRAWNPKKEKKGCGEYYHVQEDCGKTRCVWKCGHDGGLCQLCSPRGDTGSASNQSPQQHESGVRPLGRRTESGDNSSGGTSLSKPSGDAQSPQKNDCSFLLHEDNSSGEHVVRGSRRMHSSGDKTLSSKRWGNVIGGQISYYYPEKDVKDFIKNLKEEEDNYDLQSAEAIQFRMNIQQKRDSLVGDNLK